MSTRSGPGWVAARSGAPSNDLNVVVGQAGFVPGSPLLGELRDWFADLPVSWLTPRADPGLTRVLETDGWFAERTGRWCGRDDLGVPSRAVSAEADELDLVRVTDPRDLAGWLDVASACGWCDDDADRAVHGSLIRDGDPRRVAWVARADGQPVAMATGWCAGPTVEMVDVAVLEQSRRQGIGGALVHAVLGWGSARGARRVVAAPSPDGWRLFESLGFTDVPVIADLCFYRA